MAENDSVCPLSSDTECISLRDVPSLKVEVKELIINDLRRRVHAALGRHEARRRRPRQEGVCLRACTP